MSGGERSGELIASNYMEIVHADCVREIVDVMHLTGDREEGHLREEGRWWWRFKYNVMHGTLS